MIWEVKYHIMKKKKIKFSLLEKFYFFVRRKLESRKKNMKNY